MLFIDVTSVMRTLVGLVLFLLSFAQERGAESLNLGKWHFIIKFKIVPGFTRKVFILLLIWYVDNNGELNDVEEYLQ